MRGGARDEVSLKRKRKEDLVVHAHKLKVTIPGDYEKRALAALAELRAVPLTPEEEDVLDRFEAFRREHPIQFSSLTDED